MVLLATLVLLGQDLALGQEQCGRHSLAVLLEYLGRPVDAAMQVLDKEAAPYSADALARAAAAAGLESEALKWTDLNRADFSHRPAILLVRPTGKAAATHFVAALYSNDEDVCISDFPAAPVVVPRSKLNGIWPGYALHFRSAADNSDGLGARSSVHPSLRDALLLGAALSFIAGILCLPRLRG